LRRGCIWRFFPLFSHCIDNQREQPDSADTKNNRNDRGRRSRWVLLYRRRINTGGFE
jgi:hypothetical protein